MENRLSGFVMKLKSRVGDWRKSEVGKTIHSVGLLCLVILSGYFAFSLAMGTSSPLAVVTGNSMIHDLEHGDLVVVQARESDDIGLGDIIVFTAEWHREAPIIHRVVHIVECGDGDRLFFTRGDNNPSDDWGFRTIDDIIGVVIMRIPLLGHLAFLLRTTVGIAAVVIVTVLTLLGPDMFRLKKRNSTEFVTSDSQNWF